jgi:tetratricopeptide (TPR) repeat protein
MGRDSEKPRSARGQGKRVGPAWLCALVCLALLPGLGSFELRAHPGLERDIERVTGELEASPDNVELYVRRAHYYRLHEEYDPSLADLDRARELDGENLSVALGRGLTLSAMGRDEEAEAALDFFIGGGGRSVPAFAGRAEIRSRAGRLDEAIGDYTLALEIQRDVDVYLARGTLQEAKGDLTAAAAGYEDGLKHLGGAVTLRLALIRVETARKEYASALELIDAELEQVPVKTEWYLRRAQVLDAAGRAEESRQALELALAEADRVIALRSSGIHLYSRAQVYLALGRLEDARVDLNDVLIKSPRFSRARELLDQVEAESTRQDKRIEP